MDGIDRSATFDKLTFLAGHELLDIRQFPQRWLEPLKRRLQTTLSASKVDINYELYDTEIHLHLLQLFWQFLLLAWVTVFGCIFWPKSANET